MAFIFPADKATFTAANGITYAWKDDHWVVQRFKGDHEVFVGAFPPNNPEEGKLWYDNSDDVIELFIYVGGQWVSATPNSEYALETRIAQNEQGIRDLWSDQTRQDFEIGGLANRVEALEGVVGQYTYIIQTANATPRNGELAFLKGDMSTTTRWGDATNIAVNPTSGSGEVWPTDEIVTGDVLRFHLKGDITMEVSAFEAKVTQNNNNLFGIDTVVKEVGTIMDGAEYEVFHLSSFDPSGLATMNYVDAQDAVLKDLIDDKADKDDVDSAIENKVNKDGDTFTNYLDFEAQGGGARFFRGSDKYFSIWSFQNNEIRCRVNPGRDFKLTGYETGNNTEKQLIFWDSSTDSLHVRSVADPERDSDGISLGYANGLYVAKTGGTMTGTLEFDGGDRAIDVLNGHRLRLKAKDASGSGRTFIDIQASSSSGAEGTDAGYRLRLYHVADPSDSYHAANKKYVDEQVASVGGGVPVGSIMMWMNSTVPDGWFKLQGGNFDTSTYPQLHAYLQGTNGYTSGKLPNWAGHYPGEYGDHLAESNPALGKKVAQKTAQPSGGAPKSSTSIPNGTTRTFNGVGNTNAYSNGASKVTIDSGWDSVTRPPTVIVHYIIKHD